MPQRALNFSYYYSAKEFFHLVQEKNEGGRQMFPWKFLKLLKARLPHYKKLKRRQSQRLVQFSPWDGCSLPEDRITVNLALPPLAHPWGELAGLHCSHTAPENRETRKAGRATSATLPGQQATQQPHAPRTFRSLLASGKGKATGDSPRDLTG